MRMTMGMGRGGLMIMPMLVVMLVLMPELVLRITVIVMFHRLFDP